MARKGGRGKRKGSSFERKICKELSLWVSSGLSGAKTDIFWRSAMSGGRATVMGRKGQKIRQSGDICAVAPEGHAFCDKWFVECKNIKELGLTSFILFNQGPLAKHWRKACKQAAEHEKEVMLIVRSRGPILIFTKINGLEQYTAPQATIQNRDCDLSLFSDMVAGDYY
jgi:hypothetical protein